MSTEEKYATIRKDIDKRLIDYLYSANYPKNIIDPIKYIFLGKGKKIRAILLIESCGLFNIDYEDVKDIALAIECIHTYSLIHDDLPAMDDDDYRRGELTLHKKYDEATAILVGDALISLAFELITNENQALSAECKIQIVNNLARFSGGLGMVGGQMLDMYMDPSTSSIKDINSMQFMKTGELFRFVCTAGPIIGCGSEDDIKNLSKFAELYGSIFQISDDLIDIESTLEIAGKSVKKDIKAGKPTLIGLLGIEESKRKITINLQQVEAILERYGNKGKVLYNLCLQLVDRKS